MSNLSNPIFQDADKAREHLESLRWPNGPVCPKCGNNKAWPIETRPGLYKCAQYKCRKQFTVTVGTVFEKSKIPLNKWLMACYLMCSSKKGVSSHQIHRTLGVTYKTALFMTHRIRLAMDDQSDEPMGSNGRPVEADEMFIGKGRLGCQSKHKVLSLMERKGRVKSFPVANVAAYTLQPFLEKHVSRNARLMTDGGGQYRTIGKQFASHETVNHSHGEYVRGDIHVNTLESYFGIMKRGIHGIYQHISQQHMHRYCAEFDHRFRYRVANGYSDMERFNLALQGIEGKRLTYRQSKSE